MSAGEEAEVQVARRVAPVDFQAVAREVNVQVAYYYQRVKWRGVEEGDLRNTAWEIALDALEHYDAAKGSVGGYVATAVRRNIATRLIFEGSPVTESWHRRHNLLGVHRAPLDHAERPQRSVFDGEEGGRSITQGAPEAGGWADEVLADRRWRVRVLSRLFEVVGLEGREGLEALLRHEDDPKPTGRRPQRLLDSIELARSRIAADPELAEAWAERCGVEVG